MSESQLLLILLIHGITTLYMTGLIWFVQVVHYPLLAQIGATEVAAYETRHRALTFWVVAPPMLLEGIVTALLCWRQPYGVDGTVVWVGAGLLLMVWVSTAFLQVPCHRRLSLGFDALVHRRLVRTNWIRTVCWTLRATLACLMVWNVLTVSTQPDEKASKVPQVGAPAPDFAVKTSDGKILSLADYRGRSAVVLFFYPKDGTSICTLEACAFRDSYEDFVDVGAVVIGVSSDSDTSHDRFAQQHQLTYPLISDSDGALRRLYAVPNTFGIVPGRVTYVIDKRGIVRLIFNSQFTADGHVEEALRILKELRTES